MGLFISFLLSFAWGMGCAAVIDNPYISLPIALAGGVAIGLFVPGLLGA